MTRDDVPASPPGIELRHLRYFLAVYEELHFGRAAERLHIAQPPLSQAIRKLERELGVELFTRTSRKVQSTPAADVFAEEARRVLAGFEFAVTEVQRVGREAPLLRVGSVSYVPTRRLQKFLSALKERNGSMQTQVTHHLTLEQIERLRSGELDLAVFAHFENYEGIEWEPLFAGEPLVVFLAEDHRLASKRVITPNDLVGETLVTYPRKTNPAVFVRFIALMEDAGYRFKVRETNADIRDVMLAVAEGLGVAMGPSHVKDMIEVPANVVWRRLDPAPEWPETIVGWRAQAPRQLQPRLAAIREVARELRSASPEMA